MLRTGAAPLLPLCACSGAHAPGAAAACEGGRGGRAAAGVRAGRGGAGRDGALRDSLTAFVSPGSGAGEAACPSREVISAIAKKLAVVEGQQSIWRTATREGELSAFHSSGVTTQETSRGHQPHSCACWGGGQAHGRVAKLEPHETIPESASRTATQTYSSSTLSQKCSSYNQGNFGQGNEQSEVQTVLWAVLTAPLFTSSELRTFSESAECIFENEIPIYIYQDTSGIQGKHIMKESVPQENSIWDLSWDAEHQGAVSQLCYSHHVTP
ncbi:uncharacterized protein LOC142089452 [Calonectris borealis]|uniref:uncharacterized protein LOC142089452 n=1 Tax=Calonectris borealis TaxID=1323832 RepID=UPI003F4B84DB